MWSSWLVIALAATPPPPAAPAGARPSGPVAPGRASPSPSKKPAAPAPAPYCTGAYSSDFAALSKSAVELSSRPEAQFAYCLRNTAVYECLSYAPDGAVKRTRKTAIAHGTAFAYRRAGLDTLLLTNQHVAEYPTVTDEEHVVAGVPPGCKRVSDQLRLVDNEKDSFEGDDIPLGRLASEPTLDAAVVKARTPLNVMPWRLGTSANLRERNVVEVRGFPLGAFKATVEGRVTSTVDRDEYRDWDHDDFVVDALVSGGNSGSPVLAVSCATGEYELVGLYHAGYSRGSALNVVVHIDQLREFMTTLKRTPRLKAEQLQLLPAARRRLYEELVEAGLLHAPSGGVVVQAQPRADGAIVYSLFGKDFPLDNWPVLVLEDLPGGDAVFGALGRVWAGSPFGIAEVALADLEPGEQVQIEQTLELVRRVALLQSGRPRVVRRSKHSREASEELARLERDLKRVNAQGREQVQAALELAERLAPTSAHAALSSAQPLRAPEPAPDVPGPAPASGPEVLPAVPQGAP